MARKKNLKGNVTKEEMDLIDEKMSFNRDFSSKEKELNVEYVDGYKQTLRGFGYKLNIKCKTEKQKQFLNSMKDESKIICFGIGSAGTGKSFVSLSYALTKIKDCSFEHIIMVVPTAQAVGRDMQTGFLPGELDEKMKPFKDVDRYTIEKILKNAGNENYKAYASHLIDSGFIQYEFINFMLGKTFDNSLILINESEQYTKEDMKLLLTRLGENSKIIITGDCEQVNRSSIVNKKDICGLSYAAERLKDLPEISVTNFERKDIVRNPLITKILDCLD